MNEVEQLKKEIEELKQIIESKNNQVESKNRHIKRLEGIISNMKKQSTDSCSTVDQKPIIGLYPKDK